MGGIFSFLNTFFVGSLLMSVVLVVMMLFQFRQRINHLQEKSETMLQIINSIVEKMNIKEIELSGNSGGGHNSVEEISPMTTMPQIEPQIEPQMQPQTFQGFTEIENLKHQDSEGEDEDDDESDDESGEESENEGEEQSDDESEDEDEDEEQEDEESKRVDVVAIDEISQVTDIDVTENNEDEQELTLEDVNNEVEEEQEEQEEHEDVADDNSLEKMTVAQLKDAVRDRGLASNPSKLRKSELIELLSN